MGSMYFRGMDKNMNQKQKNQLTEIKKSIDDLLKNYPNMKVFVNIIRNEFNLEYRTVSKPLIKDYIINEFIDTYQGKVNDLYNLVK